MHGVRDGKLPFSHAETSDAVLTAAGVPHDFRSYDAGHEINREMQADIAAWLASRLPPR
jgi:phospholipase/carboxylesterase